MSASDAEVEAAARAICKIHARNPDHRVIPTDDYVWWQTYESDARAALDAAEAVREREADPTDSALRRMWLNAGGRFHGPMVEHGTMEEHKLLPFLRTLASSGGNRE